MLSERNGREPSVERDRKIARKWSTNATKVCVGSAETSSHGKKRN